MEKVFLCKKKNNLEEKEYFNRSITYKSFTYFASIKMFCALTVNNLLKPTFHNKFCFDNCGYRCKWKQAEHSLQEVRISWSNIYMQEPCGADMSNYTLPNPGPAQLCLKMIWKQKAFGKGTKLLI